MKIKSIISILRNPNLRESYDTNFIEEIYDGTETLRITKPYLKSFSKDRRHTEAFGRQSNAVSLIIMGTLLAVTLIVYFY